MFYDVIIWRKAGNEILPYFFSPTCPVHLSLVMSKSKGSLILVGYNMHSNSPRYRY
jgi:hypothetical protein